MTLNANNSLAEAAVPEGAGDGFHAEWREESGNAPNGTPMTIGEVARAFGMTLRALRFYESKRLVTPQRRGATRLYNRSDLERLTLVITGRRLGFTLAEITDLVGGPAGKNLHLTREQCVEQIHLLERQKRGIDVAIAELRQICTSFYRALLEDTGPSMR